MLSAAVWSKADFQAAEQRSGIVAFEKIAAHGIRAAR
jgi:hypothetical protein